MLNRQNWLAWTQVLLGFALVLVFVPALFTNMVNGGKRDYSHVASLNRVEMQRRLDVTYNVIHGKPGARMEDYFQALLMAAQTDQLFGKYVREHPNDRDILITGYGIPGTYMLEIDDLMMAYQQKFGVEAFRDVAASSDASHTIDGLNASVMVKDETSFPSFIRSVLASVIIAAFFFAARVKGSGMLVWPEIPRIALFVFAWPAMVWRYPREVNALEQIRRLKRWVAWLIASALPLMSMGVARAQEKTAPVDESGTVYVLKPHEVPKPVYALSLGIVDAKVAGNGILLHDGPIEVMDANVTYGNGVSLDFWQSHALTGSRGSDERDYTLSDTQQLGKNLTGTAGIAYFDIEPLGSAKAGDMFSLFGELDHAVGAHDTMFARADTYLMTGGSKGRNGVLLSGGVNDSRALSFGFALDQSFSAAYAKGPFGQDEGVSLCYQGALSTSFGRMRLKLLELKGWLPIAGSQDRKPTTTVGMGMAYAF